MPDRTIQLPLEQTDEAIVKRLLATSEPSDFDLLEAGRLIMRYSAYAGKAKIANDLLKLPLQWNITIEEIYRHCRALWTLEQTKSHYTDTNSDIGSGNDVVDSSKESKLNK
jgi:hypothetical protein